MYKFMWILYTLYTLYTNFGLGTGGSENKKCTSMYTLDRGWCTVCEEILPPIHTRLKGMYTLYTMFTHFVLTPRRAYMCVTQALLAIIYGILFRILGAMHNGSFTVLFPTKIPNPHPKRNEGQTTLIYPIFPILPDPFSDLFDLPQHLRRITVQMTTNLNIRSSPCEQPPQMYHPLHIPYSVRTTEDQKLSNRGDFHPVKRRSEDQLVEPPPQSVIPPRVRAGRQLDRCIQRKIWLVPERFTMRVKLQRFPGYMRLRRNRDRWKSCYCITCIFRHSMSPLPIIPLRRCVPQPLTIYSRPSTLPNRSSIVAYDYGDCKHLETSLILGRSLDFLNLILKRFQDYKRRPCYPPGPSSSVDR